MHPHGTPNGSLPSLPGWSRTALALIAQAGSHPIDLYERVSGGRQEKEQTIDTQHDVLTSGIELSSGRVGEVFKDNPFTGTVSSRPGLNKLRAAARLSHQAGRTRYLLIYDTGRLARGEPWLRPMIEDELRQLGIQVAYVLNETDESDEGMVMDGLRSLFDAWERKKIARRLADGRQKKINRGAIWRSTRKRPFGWMYRTPEEMNRAGHGEGRHPKDGEVVQHPDEVPIVEEIIRRIATGEITAHAMAAELNQRGIRTTAGNWWRGDTVGLVVRNPLHSGRVPERRYETVLPKRPYKTMDERKSKQLKSSHRRIDPSAWVPLSRQPTPIVTPELQDAAIAEMARRNTQRNATRRTNRFFLLRGLVYCMAPCLDHPEIPCERRMQGEAPPQRRPFYRCCRPYPGTADRPGRRCRTKVPAEALEDYVWAWLYDTFTKEEKRDRLLRDMGLAQETDALAIAEAEAALVAAHRAVEEATTAIDHVLERFEKGKLTEEHYDRLYPKRCEAREAAQGRLAEAQRRRADAIAAGARWVEVEQYVKDMQAKFEEADSDDGPEGLQRRAKMIQHLIERVEIYPNGRKRIVGRLRCITGEVPKRVAGTSTIGS
jgi:DNA invertase Pin-like site-specific DNA recombinase